MNYKIFLSGIKFYYNKIKYKKHVMHFGKGIKIYGRIKLTGKNIYIGDNSTLNEGTLLNGRELLKIGNNVRISSYVQIYTGYLDLNTYYKKREHGAKSVVIGDGVWLAAGCIILPGVKIGEGSVIAAGAVVTKNVGKFELWGGVPAKKIKDLTLNCLE